MDISFVIPVYNTPVRKIEKCIQSLLKIDPAIQSEIIIVDDGSQKSVADGIADIANRYPTVVAITQKNAGASAARNRGIEAAKGKYVSFVDSDDTVFASAIKRPFVTNEYDLVLFDMKIRENGKNKYVRALERPTGKISVKDVVNHLAVSASINGPVAKLYRREMLNQQKVRFNTKLISGEDLDFLIQFVRLQPDIYYTGACFYLYKKDQRSYLNRNIRHTDAILKSFFWNTDHIKELIHQYNPERTDLLDEIDRYNLESLFQLICDLVHTGNYSKGMKERVAKMYAEHFADKSFKNRKAAIEKALIRQNSTACFRLVAGMRTVYLRHGVHF